VVEMENIGVAHWASWLILGTFMFGLICSCARQ